MKPVIIFLDIDGVLCTTRTSMSHTQIPNVPNDFWDEVACAFLVKLLTSYNGDVKIVISSTWRLFCQTPFDESDILGVRLIQHKLIQFVHKDWSTRQLGNRGLEVKYWLDKHPEIGDRYIIVDDFVYDFVDEQESHIIQTDTDDGMSTTNMLDLRKMLKNYE